MTLLNKTEKGFILLILLASSWLMACRHSTRQSNHTDQAQPRDSIRPAIAAAIPEDSIVYDQLVFPSDSLSSARILSPGIFHSDEVEENAAQLSWLGLFAGSGNHYLQHTAIRTAHVHDAVLDETEDEKTGWEVTSLHKDSCLLLIEPLSYLTERSIEAIPMEKAYIYPGQSVSFTYAGVQYTLFATGEKRIGPDGPEWPVVVNYKLYLSATVNGREKKSLLVAQPSFEDKMITLLFAGDIDGDGIPDLIIDTSNHYNATIPTLYLSQPAGNEELLKPVGAHLSVGC